MDPTPQALAPAAAGPVASPAPSGGGQPAPAGNGAGSGLPSVDAILAKRAAGTKLSKAEAARLSWVGRQKRPGAPQGATAPAPGSPDLGGSVAGGGPQALPPAPPVDEALCRSTASEILDVLNEAGRDSVKAKAKAAEANEETTRLFVERASLKPGSKTTLVNTAPRWLPKLVRIAGLDPENAPEAMAGIAALLWGVGFLSVSAKLDKLTEERARQTEKPKD